jgi:hypothetical protein
MTHLLCCCRLDHITPTVGHVLYVPITEKRTHARMHARTQRKLNRTDLRLGRGREIDYVRHGPLRYGARLPSIDRRALDHIPCCKKLFTLIKPDYLTDACVHACVRSWKNHACVRSWKNHVVLPTLRLETFNLLAW